MNWKNYTIAALLLIIVALGFNACSDQPCQVDTRTRIVTPPKPDTSWHTGQGEVVYDGYIRHADWEKMTITYESANGYIKIIGPICGRGLPVWAGMHIYEMNFHWHVDADANPNSTMDHSCFDIDFVQHAPTGDYKP